MSHLPLKPIKEFSNKFQQLLKKQAIEKRELKKSILVDNRGNIEKLKNSYLLSAKDYTKEIEALENKVATDEQEIERKLKEIKTNL